MLKRGNIVLVPFPFTDLSSQKVRPAVVISVDNEIDIVLTFISSVLPEKPGETDLIIEDTRKDFKETGLKKPSVIKANKVVTLDRSMVLRKLGQLSSELQIQLDQCLRRALGL